MSTNSLDTVKNLLSTIEDYTNSSGSITASKKKLETLFEDTDYYNAGSSGKEQIEEQIEDLKEAIEVLKKEAEELQEEIDEANLEVDNKSDELSDIISSINSETTEYQSNMKAAAQGATRDAIASYRSNNGSTSFENCFKSAFSKRVKEFSGISMGTIQNLYAEYDDIKDSVSPILTTIEGYLNKVDSIQTRLDNTNATINLLTITMNNMTDTITDAYANDDYDTAVPIYSGAKAEFANKLLSTYSSRYEYTDTSADESDAISTAQQELMDSWLAQKTGDYTSGDQYDVASNPELANLRSLYESGMIDELSESGLNANQILTFISENWDVGVYQDDNGTWTIPQGHSSDAWCTEGVYIALTNLITNGSTTLTADDVDQNQMEELKTAVEKNGIIKEMYDEGFSFKEAMYLLTQLFPNAGISYDLSSQSDEKNYGLVKDSDSSGTLYSTIAVQILEYWNVGNSDITEKDDSTNGAVKKYDPITFQDGNTTYTFITDRDGDGSFDYADGTNNDLLGSENGIAELIAYDYNGDGVINKNDYTTDDDGNKVYALDQITLMANNQIEDYADKDGDGFGDVNSVDFDVTYMSARQAGITSINLSGLSEDDTGEGDALGDTTKEYDNYQEDYEDINGSSVINTFKVTMNGSTITANETLNSESNLETFYEQVADNAGTIYSTISDDEFDDAFEYSQTDIADTVDETNDILDNIRDTLEDLEDDAEDYDDSDGYELNMTWEDFVELYGADGKSGEYYQTVQTAAINASSGYAETAKHSSAKEVSTIKSNAVEAVGEAVDEVNAKKKYSKTVETDD